MHLLSVKWLEVSLFPSCLFLAFPVLHAFALRPESQQAQMDIQDAQQDVAGEAAFGASVVTDSDRLQSSF